MSSFRGHRVSQRVSGFWTGFLNGGAGKWLSDLSSNWIANL
jgi:hypothetical protein